MHTKLLEVATHQQLKDFLFHQFDELKNTMPEIYRDMECQLYEAIYGEHFSDWKYECAVAGMENADGTRGAHWSVKQITDVAKDKGLKFEHFNEYDFAYVMNMMFSDYYGVVSDSVDTYFRLAKAFIEDKDAPEGKAFRYWKAMRG